MTTSSFQRLHVREALFDKNLPALDFVLPGLLTASIGLIVSPGGVGKSFVALETALAVAAGRDVFGLWGGHPDQGPVVYLNLEDPILALRHRLSAMGTWIERAASMPSHASQRVDFSKIDWDEVDAHLDVYPAMGTDFAVAVLNERGQPEIAAGWNGFIESMKVRGPRLVILDTLNRAIPGLDENSAGHMSLVLSALERLARAVECAVVVLHHTNKVSMAAGTGAEQQAIRGSSALSDNARWQVNLMRMSREEGARRGLDDTDRREWIRFDAPKMSYAPATGERWLARTEGGVVVGDQEPPEVRKTDTAKRKGRSDDI